MGAGAKPVSFFEELKRRNVFRVGIAYLLGAWVLLQAADFGLQVIDAPNWILQVLVLIAAIGLPAVLFFAWVFEMTPEGLKRETEIDRSQSIATMTGRKLDRAIIVVLGLAVVFLLYQQFAQRAPEIPGASKRAVVEQKAVAETPAVSQPTSDHSIAVLPFVNMSADRDNEYFSDGITEEILNRLAKIRELQVTARTSVFSFKGKDRDVREIGDLLGVSNILEGSVRKDGEQVRITAQLIRTSDGFHLWSETYDRKLESIFAVQDEIASEIASALELSLGIAGEEPASRAGPVDPKVYDLYLRGRELHRKRDNIERAIELFQQALAIDPGFAPAWAGLAHAFSVLEFYVTAEQLAPYGDQHASSLAAAQRALELEPNQPSALHAIGNYYLTRFDWSQAQSYYEAALKADPDSTDVMEDYGSMLLYSMQIDAARQVIERMVELDPYVPLFQHVAAGLFDTMGNYHRRDQHIRRLLDLAPDSWFAGIWIMQRWLAEGNFEDMRQQIDRVNAQPGASRDDLLEAIAWLQDPRQEPGAGVLRTVFFSSTIAIQVGRFDVFYRVALTKPPNMMVSEAVILAAQILPPEDMHRLRTHPGVRDLISTLRLPEYWDQIGWPDICRRVGKDDFECS
jgi:TolB-like protein/lipoprotein NlpI